MHPLTPTIDGLAELHTYRDVRSTDGCDARLYSSVTRTLVLTVWPSRAAVFSSDEDRLEGP